MPEDRTLRSPVWLRLLAGIVLALMGTGLAYALAIALLRFSEIGV